MANLCVIMRGIPGSGKSSHVHNVFSKATVCSADDFFLTRKEVDGEIQTYYDFDPSKIGEAHSQCFNKFLRALQVGKKKVVVDNTNINYWEYQNYLELAVSFNYRVMIIEMPVKTIDGLKTAISRNVHGVPDGIICKMALQFKSHRDLDELVRTDVDVEVIDRSDV